MRWLARDGVAQQRVTQHLKKSSEPRTGGEKPGAVPKRWPAEARSDAADWPGMVDIANNHGEKSGAAPSAQEKQQPAGKKPGTAPTKQWPAAAESARRRAAAAAAAEGSNELRRGAQTARRGSATPYGGRGGAGVRGGAADEEERKYDGDWSGAGGAWLDGVQGVPLSQRGAATHGHSVP